MKKWMIPAISAVSAGAVSYVVLSDKKRESIKKIFRFGLDKEKKNSLPLETAGLPEEDQTDNAKMVSEGSQFGVNYYNKVKS